MDFRGIDFRGMEQSPQAQAPVQIPPSLLQMAQGGAPQMPDQADIAGVGTGGGGGGGDSGRGGQAGLSWDVNISPQDKARYFGAYGEQKLDDPQQVAAEGGISLGQLAGGFLPRYGIGGQGYDYASDRGGFFNAQDLYRKLGRDVPGIATHQMSGPSTNNWRLLGMGPDWIMRNGSLIYTKSASALKGGAFGHDLGVGRTAEEGMAAHSGSPLGSGAGWGTPNRWGDSFYWPGAATGGYASRWPSGTNV